MALISKSALLGGLILSWLTAACAGSQGSQEGGMDGAGSIALGLRWDQGVFTQPVWENGSLAYLVLNDRNEDVALAFSRARCSDTGPMAGCTYGETLATWLLPARTLRRITGADVAAISDPDRSDPDGLLSVTANGTRLGLVVSPEVAPRASELRVLSNAGINSTRGARPILGQVETDFLFASAAAFTISLSFATGGDLSLSSKTPSVEGFSFVDVVAVRSLDASIRATEGGFRVAVPATASSESPVRVDVDVELPADFSGKLVGFDAWICAESDTVAGCVSGPRIQRGIPVEPPLD